MNILIYTDVQEDFVFGSLGNKEAQEILPNVVEYANRFDGQRIFTMDTHQSNYLGTREGKMLPVKHCIGGTKGWELCGDIEMRGDDIIVKKGSFGSLDLIEHVKKIIDNKLFDISKDEIIFVGFCTDICVISNMIILSTAFPESSIVIESQYCAGATPQKHESALDVMRSCLFTVR